MNSLTNMSVAENRDTHASTSTSSKPKTAHNNQPSIQSTNSTISYVSAVKSNPQVTVPKKEQAIVMHALEQLKLYDYVKSLSGIVGAKNIIFASKISNNRICIYLASTQAVDNLLNTHDKLTIGDVEVSIRRLINPAKRIVISNVAPHIPNETIETALKNTGLKLASPVSYLRAGLQGGEFSHIYSFRRQAYASPAQDGNLQVQSTIVVTYEDTSYRIFLSTDHMECFICREQGHISSNCPRNEQTSTNQHQQRPQKLTESQETVEIHETPTEHNTLEPYETPQSQEILELDETSEITEMQHLSRKRPAASTPSDTTTLEKNPLEAAIEKQPDDSNFQFTLPLSQKTPSKPPKKKSKAPTTDNAEENQERYDTLKEIFTNHPQDYDLTYENFQSFLDDCHGNHNPLAEARRYTKNVISLLDSIKSLYSRISDRSIRNRFTRLTKRLKKQLQDEGIETESISSISSQISQASAKDIPYDDFSDDINPDPSSSNKNYVQDHSMEL